jgi:predicted porin
MKFRSLAIASAMLFAGAARAQSSVTLYGLLDTGVVYTNNARTSATVPNVGGSSWAVNSNNINTSRWGIRGNEDLGGGLSAVFTLESGFNVNNGQFRNGGDLFGRQAYVGLSSNTYGSITMGRQYDFIVNFVAPMSATGSGFGGNLAAHPYDNDNLDNDMRLNNSVKFSSASFNGLKFGAMYAFSNTAGQFGNNGAYSAGVSYSNGPINLGAGYVQINRSATTAANMNNNGAVPNTDGDALTTGGRQQIWAAGAQYMFGKSSASLVYTHSSTDNVTGIWQGGSTATGALGGNGSIKFDNFEINGRYFVRPDLSLGASYTYTMATFDGTGAAKPHWNQIMAQADYLLSPRTDIYLAGVYQRVGGGNGNAVFDASIYNFSPSTTNEQVIVTTGIRHRF